MNIKQDETTPSMPGEGKLKLNWKTPELIIISISETTLGEGLVGGDVFDEREQVS